MEVLFDLVRYIPIICLSEVLCIVFSVLFMHFSAKHRNGKLSLGWYICGVLFSFCTVIAFLIKRKAFPGPETKVCYQCSDRFPESFRMCPKCLIDLPEINSGEKEKFGRLSKFFGIGIIVTYLAAVIVGIFMGNAVQKSIEEYSDVDYRIAVDGVFYDKMGNSYEDENSVLLYDEAGNIYTYTVETVNENGFEYEESFYVRSDGQKYFYYDCYVTDEGWFFCDKAGELELKDTDTGSMTEEELDEYYNSLIEDNEEEYRYYDYPYTDTDGNIYYDAYEASWNEKGELITAENDVSVS